MADYRSLTDEQLNTERVALMKEMERRRVLAAIPGQIQELADQYADAGGDPQDLPAPSSTG